MWLEYHAERYSDENKNENVVQSSDFDANATCGAICAWPLRKFSKMSSKVIFLERVFNDEKNDTLVGSLRAILPDLNVSTIQLNFGLKREKRAGF